MKKSKKLDLTKPENRQQAIVWTGNMLAFFYSFDYIADFLRTVPFIEQDLPQAINRVRVLFAPAFTKFMKTFAASDALVANEELLKLSGYIDESCKALAQIPFNRLHLAPGLLNELAEKDMVVGWKELGDTYTDETLNDWCLVFTDGQHVGIGRLVMLAGEWRGYIYGADGKATIVRPTHYMPAKDLLGTLPKP